MNITLQLAYIDAGTAAAVAAMATGGMAGVKAAFTSLAVGRNKRKNKGTDEPTNIDPNEDSAIDEEESQFSTHS